MRILSDATNHLLHAIRTPSNNSDNVTYSMFSMWYVHFVHFIMSVMCLRWACWFLVLGLAVSPGRSLGWVIFAKATNGASSCSSLQTLFSIGTTHTDTPVTPRRDYNLPVHTFMQDISACLRWNCIQITPNSMRMHLCSQMQSEHNSVVWQYNSDLILCHFHPSICPNTCGLLH